MAEKNQIKSAKTDTKQTKRASELKNETHKSVKKPIYFSFAVRFTFLLVLFIAFLAISAYSLTKAVLFENEKIVSYKEKGNLDYSVCLFDNDFYEQKCINKDMKYIASLIDKVRVNYNYQFDINDNVNMVFNYNIKARLVITDPTSGKMFYEKEYMLISPKTLNIENDNKININEILDIDYKYYNNIANQFRNIYGIDPESKLIVYMNINKANSATDDSFVMNKNSIMNISIPLSEKSIEIEINHNDVDSNNSVIVNENDIFTKNIVFSCIALISIVLTLIITVKVLRLVNAIRGTSCKYDKYVKKILKEYDRLIAETKNLISFEGKEIVKFEKFSELLDIHDNLGLPIMHYTVTPHIKSYFYIVHENMIYLYTLKAIDLDNKKKK